LANVSILSVFCILMEKIKTKKTHACYCCWSANTEIMAFSLPFFSLGPSSVCVIGKRFACILASRGLGVESIPMTIKVPVFFIYSYSTYIYNAF
jgi:hypothetical protein